MKQGADKMVRLRLAYAIAVLLAIMAGLASRMPWSLLPDFVREHFGDALWASMIYYGFRVLGPRRGMAWALVCGFLFCIAIEFSQLYQAERLNDVRATVIGGLVLGHGFLPVDLVRYGAGVLFAYGADRLISYCYNRRKKGLH
ncbi:DUF2809 domain-containing protein [Paenibacillus nanensis]|uniref:DUF2809 domain-containing protein n=2 Tax=Paenibacillus nanensis TaxID=393251 RepID=A0A3A1VK52_9BACL|nr:DUF2809 domain-containing protein [Paenibacillus nanensis]